MIEQDNLDRFKKGSNFWNSSNKDKIEICRRKISQSKIGHKNPMWRGEKVSYRSLHEWIRCNKAKILLCEICKINLSIDLANTNHLYSRNINEYKWLCRSCHMKYDYSKKFRIHYTKKINKQSFSGY